MRVLINQIDELTKFVDEGSELEMPLTTVAGKMPNLRTNSIFQCMVGLAQVSAQTKSGNNFISKDVSAWVDPPGPENAVKTLFNTS